MITGKSSKLENFLFLRLFSNVASIESLILDL